MRPYNEYIKLMENLTIISSCGCNLECEYCMINKSKNENSHNLQLATMKALDDGSFLQNVKNTLYRLKIPFSQIRKIELWGQEPTLTIQFLTKHLQDWYNTFPCWNDIFFSTNTMEYPDRIVDFLLKLDECATHDMNVRLQFSYDGEYSTNNIRGANDQKIYDNLCYIIDHVNTYKFKHIEAHCYLHGVLSLALLKQLQTSEQIRDYYDTMSEYTNSLTNRCTNNKFFVDHMIALGLENPVDASTDDGILLASFIQKTMAIPVEDFKYYSSHLARHYLLTTMHGVEDKVFESEVKTVDEFVERMFSDKKFFEEVINWHNGAPFCSTNVSNLHVMYDGTIVTCQNYIFDTQKDYLVADNDFEMSVKKSLIDHNMFINPMKATDEEIARFWDLYVETKRSSFQFILDHVMTLMYWMSKVYQVNPMYAYDEKLLFKHALLVCIINTCIYNNRLKTGSLYTRWCGFVRFYCNGYVDQIETELNYMIAQREKEREFKKNDWYLLK